MKKILILILALFSPAVFAADTFSNEFIVYGSFDSVVNGFTRVALIFNNSDYSILLYVFVFIAILVGTLISLGQEALGTGNGKQTFSMFIIPLFGVTLFRIMMLPTSTMHIYDHGANRYQTVGSVPSLIAVLAEGVNLLERFSTTTFNTSSTTREKHANGTTLQLYLDFAFNDPISDNHYLKTNLSNFLEVCLPVAITSPSYTFDFDVFQTGTNDILTYMANLRSTSNFMTYYYSTVKGGEIIDCATGYDRIHSILIDPVTFENHIKNACEASGYDTSTASTLAFCKTRIDEISDLVLDASVTISVDRLAASQAIANSLYELMANSKGSAISAIGNKRQMTEGIGSIIIAEGWLPVMRYNTLIIILSLTPFFGLMFVTPMLFKSLHIVTTLFIFIAIWGLIDSIMHGIIFDQILDMMLELKTKNGGIQAMLMAPNKLQSALAMFGKQQSLGVGLATLLTAIFFKFSGHAFANMGEKLGGDIDNIGNRAGSETLDPETNMSQMEKYSGASEKHELHQEIGTNAFGKASGFNAQRQINDANQYMEGMTANNYTHDEATSMYSDKTGGNMAGSTHAMQTRADFNGQSMNDFSSQRSEIDTHNAMANSEFTESLLPIANNGISPMTPEQTANSMSSLVATEQSDLKGKLIANEGDSDLATNVSTTQSSQKIGSAAAASQVAMENGMTIKDLQEDITDTNLRSAIATSDATHDVAAETKQSEQALHDRNALQNVMEQYGNTSATDHLQNSIEDSKLNTVMAQKGQVSGVLNDEQAGAYSENSGAQDIGAGVYSGAFDNDGQVTTTTAKAGNSATIDDNDIYTAKKIEDTSSLTDDSQTDRSGYDSQNRAIVSLSPERRVNTIEDAYAHGQQANMHSQLLESFQTHETLTDREEWINNDSLNANLGVKGSFAMGSDGKEDNNSSVPKANIASRIMSAAGLEASVNAGLGYNKQMSDIDSESSSLNIDKYGQILETTRVAANEQYNNDHYQTALAVNSVYEELLAYDAERLTREVDSNFNPIEELMDIVEDALPGDLQDDVNNILNDINEFDDEPSTDKVNLR